MESLGGTLHEVSVYALRMRLNNLWGVMCRAFSYDASSSATLSEQLSEPVTALKGGLTHLGDAMSSVTAFIPGVPPVR